MNRIFHRPQARTGSYFALAIFAVTYIAAMALVLTPGLVAP